MCKNKITQLKTKSTHQICPRDVINAALCVLCEWQRRLIHEMQYV